MFGKQKGLEMAWKAISIWSKDGQQSGSENGKRYGVNFRRQRDTSNDQEYVFSWKADA